MYTINIMLEPEIFNRKPMYFWMIEGKTKDGIAHNCGHGWSESISRAAEDANKYYKENIKNN